MMDIQNTPNPLSDNAWDQWARRAARRAGLEVRKCRHPRRGSLDNEGGFQVLDSQGVIDGFRYELTAEQVIDLFGDDVDSLKLNRIRTGQPIGALNTQQLRKENSHVVADDTRPQGAPAIPPEAKRLHNLAVKLLKLDHNTAASTLASAITVDFDLAVTIATEYLDRLVAMQKVSEVKVIES